MPRSGSVRAVDVTPRHLALARTNPYSPYSYVGVRWENVTDRERKANVRADEHGKAGHGVVSIWGMAEAAPAPVARAVLPAPTPGGPRRVVVTPARALSERLVDAHHRRVLGGAALSDGPGASGGSTGPHDEMLRFVVALDDRSLMSKGIVAGPTSAGPLPRRLEPEALPTMLPRRVSPPAVATDAPDRASTAGPAPGTCPSCAGARLGIDGIDLDAATCRRTCADCGTSFSSSI